MERHTACRGRCFISKAATLLTLVGLLIVPQGLQGQQKRLNLVKIHTNAPRCTLKSVKTGRLLATADASGNLRWEPDIIRRKDKRVRIEGLHFIPSTIKIKRRVRLGSVLMSTIEGGLAGIAIGDFTNETGGTSFAGYENPASTGGAAAFVLGLMSNRNYVVAPKSRFMEVRLKYDPAFMNEQWSIVKSSNSLEKVEDFKLAYPEFHSMAAVDELLMNIRIDEVESVLLDGARSLLGKPENMAHWQGVSLNAALREFRIILEDFKEVPAKANLAARIANMESEAATIRMLLQSQDAFDGLMTGIGSAPDGPLDYWRLAGWLNAWGDAPPSERRKALAGLANVAKPWAAALKESKVMQETGGASLMADLTKRLSDCDTSLVGFFNAFNDVHEAASAATTAVDEAHWPLEKNGFSALLEHAWNSYLNSTELPRAIEEDIVRSFWRNIQHGDGSGQWPELTAWAGVIIPKSATIEDIMSSVESPLLLADLKTPIPLGDPVIEGMIPSKLISNDQFWRDMLPTLSEDALAWVIIGDSLNSRNGFSLGFQSGHTIKVNNFEKPSKALVSGKIWDGIYTGTQPGFPMTGKNGRPLIIAGKTVEVPSSRHDISLQGKIISVTQRSSDTKAEMTGVCTVSEGADFTSFQCKLSDEDGASNPSCSMELDMVTGALSFEWEGEQGPGFIAHNLDYRGNLLPLGQEVWILRDAQGEIRAELCTDWVDYDASKPFFPKERLDVLTVDHSSGSAKVDIIDNIDILLEAIAQHAGWKSSTGMALTNAQDELAELIIRVELALTACEEYEEVGTNLPIPISTSSLKRQRSEWNRHSSRMSDILDAVQTNMDRAHAKKEKARKKFYWKVYKAGYIYVKFKDDGSYETYQKESQYTYTESCMGMGSWYVEGNDLILEYNASRCDSNREITGTYQIDGTWLMGKKNFYEVE